jgi:hypothetical protein
MTKPLYSLKGSPVHVAPVCVGMTTLGLMHPLLEMQGKAAYIRPKVACLVIG